jgi:hypothetical protein
VKKVEGCTGMNRDEGNKRELLKHKIMAQEKPWKLSIMNRVVHAKGTSRAKNPDT